MTAEKLARVLWRARTKYKSDVVTNKDLERCIMLEIGTDKRTIKRSRVALLTLKWITPDGNNRVKLTGLDLEES